MRKVLKADEIDMLREYVKESSFSKVNRYRHAFCELENGSYLISFNFWDVRKPAKKHDRTVVFCSRDTLMFFTDNVSCHKAVEQIDEDEDNFAQVCEFFLSLTAEDIYALDEIEHKITVIEDVLLTNPRMNSGDLGKIIHIRRELLNIKRYYEQISMVVSELAMNKGGLFDNEVKKRFDYFLQRTDRLMNAVSQLREYITQVREAYQAQIDIEQNQIMRVFTVITAVFLPLTLIVGWYGMNVNVPEYGWSFGYPFVVILSLTVSAACIAFFKIKKWF